MHSVLSDSLVEIELTAWQKIVTYGECTVYENNEQSGNTLQEETFNLAKDRSTEQYGFYEEALYHTKLYFYERLVFQGQAEVEEARSMPSSRLLPFPYV